MRRARRRAGPAGVSAIVGWMIATAPGCDEPPPESEQRTIAGPALEIGEGQENASLSATLCTDYYALGWVSLRGSTTRLDGDSDRAAVYVGDEEMTYGTYNGAPFIWLSRDGAEFNLTRPFTASGGCSTETWEFAFVDPAPGQSATITTELALIMRPQDTIVSFELTP